MKEYYVFTTKGEADTCLAQINGSGWFPIVGKVAGTPAPQNTKTEKWALAPSELLTGEWAVPRVPTDKLDLMGVPQEDRDAFLAAFGKDIRILSSADFPAPVEE